MSLTPIYDELRALRITQSAGSTSGSHRVPARVGGAHSEQDKIGQLAGRRGLGGRHRRPSE